MESPLSAVKISEHVYWVGAIDWELRDFHGYATERGTTYNAFLIMADKITLVDTVKASFLGEMMARVESVIDPTRIDYIVSNHSEMDHSGALPAVIRNVNPEKVFASAEGARAIEAHFHGGLPIEVIKDGQAVPFGGGNLTFVETPMLHWPDSMFTFYDTDGVLFSQDAFGMHLATSERFADEIDVSILEFEAAKYFANILMPYAPLAKGLLDKMDKLDLPVRTLAPDHGPVYRANLDWILGLYREFAAQKPVKKAVVVYDTMWGSTDKMASAISKGVSEKGCAVEAFDMGRAHRSDVATAVLRAGAIVVGSPTINNGIFPTVVDVMSYLKGLRPKNLVGAAFGSYGWSGESVKQIEETLSKMKVEIVSDAIGVNYVPTQEDLEECRRLGNRIADKLDEVCGSAGQSAVPLDAKGGRKTMQRYVCDVCGYIYDPEAGDPLNGIGAGVAFEDLPDDWVCPKCKQGKDVFSPLDS